MLDHKVDITVKQKVRDFRERCTQINFHHGGGAGDHGAGWPLVAISCAAILLIVLEIYLGSYFQLP